MVINKISKSKWLEYDASQQANQNRMREEMSQKLQEEAGSFQPHYMMHPPMGMNPMMMNQQPFQPHAMSKEDQGNGGNANGSNNSVGGNSNSGGGSGGPNQDGNSGNHNPQQQHWNMNPNYPTFPSPQDIMYQGFDPRMAYGFHPPWGRGHPMVPGGPMDHPGMMPFDNQNPMMHQMGGGWGPGGNFYNMPPPHLANASSHPGARGEMPQSYENSKGMPQQGIDNNNNNSNNNNNNNNNRNNNNNNNNKKEKEIVIGSSKDSDDSHSKAKDESV